MSRPHPSFDRVERSIVVLLRWLLDAPEQTKRGRGGHAWARPSPMPRRDPSLRGRAGGLTR